MSIIYIVSVSILFVLFLTTAGNKVIEFSKHIVSMEKYRIVPQSLIVPLLVSFTGLEFILSYFFITFRVNLPIMLLAIGLLSIYTFAILINLLRGNVDISCGCGSVLENERLSYGLILRNIVLILSVFSVFIIQQNLTFDFTVFTRVWMILFAVGIFLFVGVLKAYRSQLFVLRYIKKIN